MISIRRRSLVILLLVIGLIGTIIILRPNADNPELTKEVILSLSPSTKSVNKDSTFTVSIHLATSDKEISAVQANLSYPADKLEFVSADNDGGAFNIPADNSGGSGSIAIARGSTTPLSDKKALIGNITFKAIATGEEVKVEFKDSSVVLGPEDESNLLDRTLSGSYTLK